MGVTVLFYKLFGFKADLAAILKHCCCHGNVTYKFVYIYIYIYIYVYEFSIILTILKVVDMGKSFNDFEFN